MTNIEEINKIIENLYEELNEIKVIMRLLKNEVYGAELELYELQQRIKKETTAQ